MHFNFEKNTFQINEENTKYTFYSSQSLPLLEHDCAPHFRKRQGN